MPVRRDVSSWSAGVSALSAFSAFSVCAAFAALVVPASGCLDAPSFTTLEQSLAAEAGADAEGVPDTDAGDVDTGVPPDEAQAACLAVCPAPATCEAGVCVRQCTGGGMPGVPPSPCETVTCPVGIACQVRCMGKDACKEVDCGTASECTIECNGDNACKKIVGEAGITTIQCSGRDACKDMRCGGSTCAVQCNPESCQPMATQCCATTCTVNGGTGTCR